MAQYGSTQMCLQSYICRYFGDEWQRNCGHCSNCLARTEKLLIFTKDTQKVLSCVKRDGRKRLVNYGYEGFDSAPKDQKIKQWKFEELSTYV